MQHPFFEILHTSEGNIRDTRGTAKKGIAISKYTEKFYITSALWTHYIENTSRIEHYIY